MSCESRSERLFHLVLLGALLVSAPVARAQDTEGSDIEVEEGAAGADVDGADADGADDEDSPPAEAEAEEAQPEGMEEARARFRQGLALADAGNCSGALAEFEAALTITRRPSLLYNIARCQEQLNRYDLAIEAYRVFLDEAELGDPDRPAAERTVEQLGRLLGTIHVGSNVEAEVWLGDRIVGQAPGDVLVPGGSHVLELRAAEHIPERREVTVSAGGDVAIDVVLSTAQEVHQHETNITVDAPPLPVALTATMIGLTAATIGVGVGFGVHALTLSDAERARDARLPRDREPIDEAALFADIFYVAGGVLAAATIAMAFLTDWDDRGSRTGEDQVRVIPLLGPLFAGIRVEGIQ